MVNSDRSPSSDDITNVENDARNHSMAQDRRRSSVTDANEKLRSNTNAKLANPLAYETPEELRRKGRAYAVKHFIGDEEDIRAFELGAWLAQDPMKWDKVQGLRPEERAILEKEITSRWSQPRLMYLVIGKLSFFSYGHLMLPAYWNKFHLEPLGLEICSESCTCSFTKSMRVIFYRLCLHPSSSLLSLRRCSRNG